ncbi:hypothetical protein BJX96DRAFT_156582 [Aspergillus floccosus]
MQNSSLCGPPRDPLSKNLWVPFFLICSPLVLVAERADEYQNISAVFAEGRRYPTIVKGTSGGGAASDVQVQDRADT